MSITQYITLYNIISLLLFVNQIHTEMRLFTLKVKSYILKRYCNITIESHECSNISEISFKFLR